MSARKVILTRIMGLAVFCLGTLFLVRLYAAFSWGDLLFCIGAYMQGLLMLLQPKYLDLGQNAEAKDIFLSCSAAQMYRIGSSMILAGAFFKLLNI